MDKSDNITYEDYKYEDYIYEDHKHTDLYKENEPKKGLDNLYGDTLYVLLIIFIGINLAVFLISFFL